MYQELQKEKIESIKSITHRRISIKKQSDKLKKMDKFKKIKEFEPGMIFGELALLYNSDRLMSIAATRSVTCLTIHKNDYQQYLNKYAKR